jgi:hypothetical protein
VKNVVAIAVIVLAGVLGWRLLGRPSAAKTPSKLAFDRLWVDHMPASEDDAIHALVLPTGGPAAFAEQSRWHADVQRFRFDVDGDTLRAVFPWTNTRETITVNATECREPGGMDFCLDVTGSTHLQQRYYSRTGWSRKDVAVDTSSQKALVTRMLDVLSL